MTAAGHQHFFTAPSRAFSRRHPRAGWLLLAVLLLCAAGSAQAGRELPSGMLVGVVDSASFPVITLKRPRPSLLKRVVSLGLYDKTISYPVAVSVRIRDQKNLFVVNGQMPLLKEKFVGLKSGINGQVTQIWVMTEAEASEYVTRPGTRFPPEAKLLSDDSGTSTSTSSE